MNILVNLVSGKYHGQFFFKSIYGCHLWKFLQKFVSSDANETQESLHTNNEMEQSTEEFILTDYEYDVLPSRKRVYNELFFINAL